MTSHSSPLSLCNEHLTELFHAIEHGDLKLLYQVEHLLTQEEECVACAYALRAKGQVRQALSHFLREEGFLVATPAPLTVGEEVRFWLIRIGLLTGLITLFIKGGYALRAVFSDAKGAGDLGAFGVVGAFLLAISTFVLINNWLLED